MVKTAIFHDTFLVTGIMCHTGCGASIRALLSDLDYLKKKKLLPDDAVLTLDAEPETLGIHRLKLTIESDKGPLNLNHQEISAFFKQQLIEADFEINVSNEPNQKSSAWKNWINIFINSLSIAAIILLSLFFPPSILLTIGLTVISFLTSAFTSRNYLINFFNNLRNNNWANMSSSVALGWILSLTHTLYHAITMPLTGGFSMLFMSYIMPILLIGIINGMDEIKRLVMNKSKQMHLRGINALFPEMAAEYLTYELSEQQQDVLNTSIIGFKTSRDLNAIPSLLNQYLENPVYSAKKKNLLRQGMLIQINPGECFPVDCLLVQGITLVDASLLNGEPQEEKKNLDFIPAGAVNLGGMVTVCAIEDSYNSTINALLFRSNRARVSEARGVKKTTYFTYFYGGLITLGIVASILFPLTLGLFTVSLMLQNITGILFAVCPCTIGIAQQLPTLLSIYYRSRQGIKLTNESLANNTNKIHTIVFDKTGTLTTGNSQVESYTGISFALWQRIYLLEKTHGSEHPLAKALYHYYEETDSPMPLIKDISQVSRDPKNRGLSGIVQGKQLHLGNLEFLEQSNIKLPKEVSLEINRKLAQGYSAVYVAEDYHYCGVIFIKHETRANTVSELRRLKAMGIKLIMLTGDNKLSATGFNQQNDAIFDPSDIYAQQTPQDKEDFLSTLMTQRESDSAGIWFVGDGLNDAPCARIISEKGGVSCAMTAEDKSSFFTDISLNGSLKYVRKQHELNAFMRKNIRQNQALLSYGAVAFLAFIISFSIAGIAVSPLIPMLVMVSTTMLTLFNSYRTKASVINALDNQKSWLNQFLSSDLSLALPAAANALLLAAILISTLATGALIFPPILFTAGIAVALSSLCLIGACASIGLFALIGGCCLLCNKSHKTSIESVSKPKEMQPPLIPEVTTDRNPYEYSFSLNQTIHFELETPPTDSFVNENRVGLA